MRWRSLSSKSLFLLASLICATYASLPQSQKCSKISDCTEDFGSNYICSPTTSTCIRDNYSWSLSEVIGFCVIFFIMLLNTSGGSGATTMLVPTIMFFFGFHSTDAIHLARFTIFMGGVTNFVLNWNRVDPKTGKFLVINYRTTAVMVPLHIAGAEIGSIINKLLPPIVILLVLFLILIRSLHNTIYRAIEETAKESKMDEKIKEARRVTFQFPNLLGESLLDPSQDTLFDGEKENKDQQGKENPPSDAPAQEETAPSGESSKAVDKGLNVPDDTFSFIRTSFCLKNIEELILRRQKELYAEMNFDTDIECLVQYKNDDHSQEVMAFDPDWKPNQIRYNPFKINQLVKQQFGNICVSLLAFVFSISSALLRGGDGFNSIAGIPKCSYMTWVVIACSQTLCMLTACLGYFKNRNISESELKANESMAIYKDAKLRRKLIVAAYFTGIGAGLAGVGGSLMLNIYTMSLGLSLSATGNFSMMSTMCSSSSTSLQSLMSGGSHLQHAYLVIIFALAGSLFANFFLRRILHAVGKYSVRVWTLVLVLGISSMVLPFQMITAIVNHSKLSFEFGSLC